MAAFLGLIPAFFLSYAAIEISPFGDFIGNLVRIPFPALDALPTLELQSLDAPKLNGAWWLLALAVVSCLFNYLLGEGPLFRGALLPKIHGVFGRWDWGANAVLFAFSCTCIGPQGRRRS